MEKIKIFIVGGTGRIGKELVSVIEEKKDQYEIVGIQSRDPEKTKKEEFFKDKNIKFFNNIEDAFKNKTDIILDVSSPEGTTNNLKKLDEISVSDNLKNTTFCEKVKNENKQNTSCLYFAITPKDKNYEIIATSKGKNYEIKDSIILQKYKINLKVIRADKVNIGLDDFLNNNVINIQKSIEKGNSIIINDAHRANKEPYTQAELNFLEYNNFVSTDKKKFISTDEKMFIVKESLALYKEFINPGVKIKQEKSIDTQNGHKVTNNSQQNEESGKSKTENKQEGIVIKRDGHKIIGTNSDKEIIIEEKNGTINCIISSLLNKNIGKIILSSHRFISKENFEIGRTDIEKMLNRTEISKDEYNTFLCMPSSTLFIEEFDKNGKMIKHENYIDEVFVTKNINATGTLEQATKEFESMSNSRKTEERISR